MHSLPLLALLAGTSATLAAPTSELLTNCITSHAADLASLSSCADVSILTHCLSTLETPAEEYISSCHLEAGCPSASADADAAALLFRCRDILSGGDLRKREPQQQNENQQHPRFAAMPLPRQDSGNDCFTTSSVKTTSCDLTTSNGHISTISCSETSAARSACKPGKTCSMDTTGVNICMDLKDSLDVAGIIIAIVFGSLITIGIGTLTFLCCKDRKEQRRLLAKKEATALARAATKKKRAAEVRQPLMSQTPTIQGPDTSALGGGLEHSGSPDPFHDTNRP